MKRSTSKILNFMAISVLCLYITSCTEDAQVIENSNEDTSEMVYAAEIDEIDAVLGDLVIDAFENTEASADSGRSAQPPSLPECVTVTLTAQQNFRELSIDFGEEGCLIRGHLIQGEILVTYNRDPEAQEVLINYQLNDFYFNAKKVEAMRSILRQRSNENDNPLFTHNLDVTVTWPNGLQASRSGTKIREWVEGAGSGVFSDNVFEITGNWTTTFISGNSHSYEVIDPLRREVTCIYFVSGTFTVERTNFGGLFDYGDGDCDNAATFTFNNGQEIDITLN